MARVAKWAKGAKGILRRPADLAGLLGLYLYALPSFWYPFARDHPIHWYIGRGILEGEFPYVSALSTKGPLAFVVHAVATGLFGDGTQAIRVMDFLFLLGGVCVAVSFRPRVQAANGARSLPPAADGEFGATALIAGTVHYTFFDFSDTGHPELWLGVLMLWAAAVVVRAPDFRVSWQRAFWAGVVACLAVGIKHVGAFTGVIVGAGIVILGLRESVGVAARNALVYTLGVASVLGAVLGAFWLGGHFDVFWDVMVVHILEYAGDSLPDQPGPPPWLRMEHGLFAMVAAVGGLAVGGAVAAVSGKKAWRFTGWFLTAMVAAAVGAVAAQHRALESEVFTYYWVMVGPFLVAAVSWGLRMAFLRGPRWQFVAAMLLMALAVYYEPDGTHVNSWNYRAEWTSWYGYVRGERTFAEHHDPHRNSRLDHHVHMTEIASHIRNRRRPGDTLCIDGWLLELYVLTDMHCDSRFISRDFIPRTRPDWAAEHRAALEASPPDFFVTFGDRRHRVREYERLGYVEHAMSYPDGARYAVMERVRDDEAEPEEAAVIDTAIEAVVEAAAVQEPESEPASDAGPE
ncbi:MAG: hypothetical protein AB8I08_17210 [Sandaracinaceae bacterium]